MESIGILCLHLLRRPLVTWTSSGIQGKWHVLQLEVLRRAMVGSAAGWQLASVRRYAVVGLSSCPFGSSSPDGFEDLWCPQAGC